MVRSNRYPGRKKELPISDPARPMSTVPTAHTSKTPLLKMILSRKYKAWITVAPEVLNTTLERNLACGYTIWRRIEYGGGVELRLLPLSYVKRQTQYAVKSHLQGQENRGFRRGSTLPRSCCTTDLLASWDEAVVFAYLGLNECDKPFEALVHERYQRLNSGKNKKDQRKKDQPS